MEGTKWEGRRRSGLRLTEPRVWWQRTMPLRWQTCGYEIRTVRTANYLGISCVIRQQLCPRPVHDQESLTSNQYLHSKTMRDLHVSCMVKKKKKDFLMTEHDGARGWRGKG